MPFDLASALPHLLEPAIAWAEEQSHFVQLHGEPLDDAGLDLARKVGVQAPERIRVIIVDALPLPANPALKAAARSTGLLGPQTAGLTLGYSIFVVGGFLSPRLISHECRHVYQYEQLGSIAAFLPVYLRQIVSAGCVESPFEQDARAHEIENR